MVHAYLTIDDFSSKNTKAIVDFLCEKEIPCLFFAWGEMVEYNYENALYALQHGMTVGNHSYSHPNFSKLSFEECVSEIEKCEAVLDKLYSDAGVPRKYRPFRFPYGDQGGENKAALQKYLAEHGFDKVKDTQLTAPWWKERGRDKDIDTFWTFDLCEYMIRPDSGFTAEDVIKRLYNKDPSKTSTVLLEDGSSHIILLHAHDETEALVPEYYKQFIDIMLKEGVVFDEPEMM